MKITINMKSEVGFFAENKEVAKKLRLETIIPALSQNDEVVIDFQGVSGATQSFIHALTSGPIRKFRQTAFDNMYYKNANPDIQKAISMVYHYMQESMDKT